MVIRSPEKENMWNQNETNVKKKHEKKHCKNENR